MCLRTINKKQNIYIIKNAFIDHTGGIGSSHSDKILENKNILVTAGPTQEAIDPVRFISNKSSGKMGYAIAKKIENYIAVDVLQSATGNDVTLAADNTATTALVRSGLQKLLDGLGCRNYLFQFDVLQL